MGISQSAIGNKAPARSTVSSICPYRNVHSEYCAASVMTMRIDQRRNATYCLTDDFDCCPVFLAKVLRGS